MKTITNIIKVAAFLFGIGFMLWGINDDSELIGNRVFYVLIGILIIAVTVFPTFRRALISLSTFCVGVLSLDILFDSNGRFNFSGLLAVVICLGISFYCGWKVMAQLWLSRKHTVNMHQIDSMSGLEFESFSASLLSQLGYTNVTTTKASGDQGIDIIAYKNGFSYAIQCKHYSSNLDNSSIQEAYAGMAHYGCDYAAVITNSFFTRSAKELALSTGVQLWDRTILESMVAQANSPFISRRSCTRKHLNDVDLTCPSSGASAMQAEHPSPLPHNADDLPVTVCYDPHSSKQEPVDNSFIAEAQWYAARGGVDLIDDE